MLNPELLRGIARKFADNARLDVITRRAYEEHCVVLRGAGLTHLKAWEQVGPIVQNAWRMAFAAAAEDILDLFMEVSAEVEKAQTLFEPKAEG